MSEPAGQSYPSQHRLGTCAGVAVAAQLQRKHHVFQRGQVRQELKGLEHEAQFGHAQPGAAIFVESIDIDAIEHDGTVGRRVQAGEQAQQRGLARAGRTDDRKRPTGLHGKIDVLQNREFAGSVGNPLAKAGHFYCDVGAVRCWHAGII
jgi:hypothetical protein